MPKAPAPPNYRKQDNPDQRCGNCRMYDNGRCWGYGNVPVKENYVCDSWAPAGTKELAKHLWAQHRRRLKEAS